MAHAKANLHSDPTAFKSPKMRAFWRPVAREGANPGGQTGADTGVTPPGGTLQLLEQLTRAHMECEQCRGAHMEKARSQADPKHHKSRPVL